MEPKTNLIPTSWQLEDLHSLENKVNSANWSQMGVYKTSTACWLIGRRFAHKKNPAILVITNRSGKGAWFRDVPRCLSEDWKMFNVKADGVHLIVPGRSKQHKISKTFSELNFDYPVIAITHYHLFSKSNILEFIECKDCDGTGKDKLIDFMPCQTCDGKMALPAPDKQCDPLLRRQWDMVILDEAHYIKNNETKWTGNIKMLDTYFKHLMTGSGFVNRPDEIWSLLNFLDENEYNDYWDFRSEFVLEDYYSGYRQIVGLQKHKVEKFREIREFFGPRHTKPEVFPNLAEPIYEDKEVELNPTQRRMFQEIKAELMALDQKGVPLYSPNVLSQLMRMRQITQATPEVISDKWDEKHNRRVVGIRLVEPSSKLDAVMDVLDGLQWDDEDKQQVVVFSSFNDPLDLLQARLDKKGIKWLRLQQQDSDTERFRKWHDEFPKKQHQVFLSTIKLGGVSIDLTPAQYVIMLDLDWSPMNNDQAIERVWRPPGFETSFKGAPIVIRMFAEDSIDQRMVDLNSQKRDWFDLIFNKNNEDEDEELAA